MAAKYQLITELYRRTGVAVAKNPQAWQSFLSAACRNYKCRFDEQLLIYAQRPDAVAVAQLETWNKQFKRWVNKDSKGIAVFDPKGRRNTLKYYFDISDTHEGYYGSRPVPIWQMSERYEQAVIERLSDRFGDVESTDLASVLMETAKNAVEDNLQDYMPQLKSCTQDSLLEELDEYNIEVIYRQLAVNSVAYMLMSRCGVDTEAVFEREDFAEIINFNTPATINALGIATSDISEMALREISQTIRDVQIAEKSQNRTFAPQSQTRYDVGREQAERSNHNERNHIHQTRGLSYSRPNITDRARNSAWQIRFDAQGLSGAAQTSDLPQSADIGQAEQTSLRSGTDGSYEVGASDKTALQGAGRDGGTERKSTDAMGRADEQYPQSSGGNDTERADLQLNVADEQQVTVNLPTVEEQIEMLAEAEDEKSSAFVISQEDIDSVLQRGSGFQNGKYRIYRQFQKNEDSKSNIDFLKKKYGTGGGTHYFPDGTQGHTWHDGKGIAIEKYGSSANPDLVFSWAKVEKRLRELIKNDRYLNEKEKDHYADYLESEEAPQYEIDTQRKMARQRFIDANRDLPPADKRDTLALRLSDFIRDLDGYEKDLLENVERTDLADVTAEQMEQHLGDPATVQQLIDFLALVQGKTADVYSRSNAWRFSQELMELYPLRYVYHEDDVVYIGADKYEIAAFDENAVSLRNPDFPLFGKELSRADFEEKLKENPANDHLKVVVTEKQSVQTPSEEKPDGIKFSIGFSEHPAFYDRQFNDRYTDLSFALGNYLLGVLDEKQHRERESKDNVGWYHKTDFEITATIGGEDFHYEGRFDIGDGEGDLISHIKNFYEYSLSPNCPFIPEWKKQGEDYYREQIESLQWGRDVFVPYLEQHKTLTPEDEKLYTEIMATESDWFVPVEDKQQASDLQPQIVAYYKSDDENIVIVQASNGKYFNHYGYDEDNNSFASAAGGFDTFEEAEQTLYAHRPTAIDITEEKQTPHYTVELTSDAFADPFIIRDNTVPYGEDGQYYDVDGIYQTFETEEEAQEYADTLNSAENIVKLFAQKDEERSQQEQPDIQDNSDLIGKEILIDNRRYVIESISEISGDASMRDMTFANAVGFPINRVEKIGYIRSLLSKAQEEKQPEKAVSPVPAPSEPRHNYRITEDTLGVGGAKEKFRNNMAAINLLHELELENRLATPEEQEILSKYVGWGGLSMAFDENNAAWADEFKELYASLSPEEYRAAMESTLTAFYTPPVVIKGMYEALERLGFSEGSILEPSCGTGNFFGLLPDTMAGSKLHGVEIDPLTGKIAKQLYQKANIAVQGFEETKLPDDHFDVVIGNVPFGDFKVNDSRYNAQKFLIHDYFFAKALDKVRAGGVVAFITSKGTMDKASPEIRKYIAQRAELLGAIRLPDNTFRANAGTEVTSDILFLQKRDRVIDAEPDWVHLDTDENGITMNSYFVQHPEMILGEMKMESTRFGFDSACKAYQDIPLSELLHNAVQNIQGEIPEYENELDEISDGQDASIPADPNVRNFSYALVDGKVYFREDDRMTPAAASVTAENRIKGLIQIRDCVRKLIEYQTEDYPDDLIHTEQENLNRLYDSFTKQYGLINSRGNYLAFASDESYFLLCSLEVLDDEGNFKRKADMFTKRTIKPHREITSVETASEALALSIGEKARVDLPYMEQLTGKPKEEIIKDLQGVIFRIPATEPAQYVTADEYLSGNVRAKLITAEAAAKENPEFAVNAQALKQVIPQDLSAAEISVRLGTTWIPQEDIQRFVIELLTPSSYAQSRIRVRYTPINGDWFIENKSSDYGNVKADSTYGTKRASAYRIIEDTLNLRDTRIFDYVYDENGNKKAVFNAKETTAAQAKQEIIKQAFQDWIWKDPERRNRLVRYYNDTFNSVRPREYDGSHITFGGISPEITLRPHQVNAIAHILYGGNTLLAHKVGAGKTFEMVAAAQESKRLGLCNKAMFVVPNHLVGQWASEYLRLYPSANILVTRKQDFETGNRKKFCSRIATGDYDAVIIGHSQFEKIPLSQERQAATIEKQIDEIELAIDQAKRDNGERYTIKQMEKSRKALQVRLDKLNDQSRKDNVVTFEQLGVDRLFVDESHNYKNLFLYTKMRNVAGIAQTEAQKSSDMFAKCQYLDEITGGKGVTFATGTPISNSMTELYTNMRYLQYGTLQKLGLGHFDAWAASFGETQTAIELAPEGTGYRAKTRFAKFFNLPELIALFKESADIQTPDMLKLPVPEAEYENVVLKPSEFQKDMVASLAERAEAVRDRQVQPYEDNMLKITNDGRKLALDQRLLNDMLPDEENSKASTCVEKAYKIWENTKEQKSAQLIFCDLSTPKGDGTFNVYEDIKNKLMEKGVPENEIAFIHDANTELRKAELFAKVRSGQVRFLLGSTAKMGAGTNVQDRLIALHHLDVPWRPSDIEQQEGRILRQGNQNDKVKIFRYVTEGTFDSYSWQLIENKQKFIGQIMTSKSPVRSCEDVDEAALSYAEVKALATGNPYIKEKMDLDIQVSKLKLMKANHTSQKYRLEDNITQHYPHQIAIFKERIEGFTADMNKYAKNKPEDKEQFFMQVGGKSYTDKKEAGTAIIAMCKEIKGINASADVGEYLGFKLNVTFDSFNNKFVMNVKGAMSHPMEVGSDPLGNITRINNVLEAMPSQLEEAQMKLSNVKHQLETAKAEVDKPFPQEAELAEKLERLAELNSLLNMDEKGDDAIGMDDEATEPEKPQEDVKKVDNREEVVADMPIKQSNLEKAAPEGERRLADRPAERTSLQEKLAAMKARVSGTPAGRDAVDKAKGKDQIL